MTVPFPSYPHTLAGLSPREEITDTITRACLAIDSNNKSLWESAWATEDPDIVLNLNGAVLTGWQAINQNCFDNVGPIDTQHLLTSVRVDLKEGADVAHVTANALNQHYRAGEGRNPGADFLLAGSTYEVEVVRGKDGQWRMKRWDLNIIWTQGGLKFH